MASTWNGPRRSKITWLEAPSWRAFGHLLTVAASFQIRQHLGHHRIHRGNRCCCCCGGHHAPNVRPVRYAHRSTFSSPHIIDTHEGDFVGNFSGFVNGNVQDLGDFENDLDRLWYGGRSFLEIVQAAYLQAAVSTSLPSLSPAGALVPSTSLPSE